MIGRARTALAVLGLVILCVPAATPIDEKLLKDAGISATGEALLTFFRKHTPTAAALAKAPALVRQLGAAEFEQREMASVQLIALGPAARPALLPALESADAEVRRRAQECLESID